MPVSVCLYLSVSVCRTYELLVHGGTPYEKDVEVDPSLTRGGMSVQKVHVNYMLISTFLLN